MRRHSRSSRRRKTNGGTSPLTSGLTMVMALHVWSILLWNKVVVVSSASSIFAAPTTTSSFISWSGPLSHKHTTNRRRRSTRRVRYDEQTLSLPLKSRTYLPSPLRLVSDSNHQNTILLLSPSSKEIRRPFSLAAASFTTSSSRLYASSLEEEEEVDDTSSSTEKKEDEEIVETTAKVVSPNQHGTRSNIKPEGLDVKDVKDPLPSPSLLSATKRDSESSSNTDALPWKGVPLRDDGDDVIGKLQSPSALTKQSGKGGDTMIEKEQPQQQYSLPQQQQDQQPPMVSTNSLTPNDLLDPFPSPSQLNVVFSGKGTSQDEKVGESKSVGSSSVWGDELTSIIEETSESRSNKKQSKRLIQQDPPDLLKPIVPQEEQIKQQQQPTTNTKSTTSSNILPEDQIQNQQRTRRRPNYYQPSINLNDVNQPLFPGHQQQISFLKPKKQQEDVHVEAEEESAETEVLQHPQPIKTTISTMPDINDLTSPLYDSKPTILSDAASTDGSEDATSTTTSKSNINDVLTPLFDRKPSLLADSPSKQNIQLNIQDIESPLYTIKPYNVQSSTSSDNETTTTSDDDSRPFSAEAQMGPEPVKKITPYPEVLAESTSSKGTSASLNTNDVNSGMFEKPKLLSDNKLDSFAKMGPEPSFTKKITPYPEQLSESIPPPISSKDAMSKNDVTSSERITPYPPTLADSTPPPKSSKDAMSKNDVTSSSRITPYPEQLAESIPPPKSSKDAMSKNDVTSSDRITPYPSTLADSTPPPKSSNEAMGKNDVTSSSRITPYPPLLADSTPPPKSSKDVMSKNDVTSAERITPYPPTLSDSTPPPKSSKDVMSKNDVTSSDRITPYPPTLSDSTPPPKSSKDVMSKNDVTSSERVTPYPPSLSDTTPPPKSSKEAMSTTDDVLKPMFQQRPQPLADVADKTPKTGPEPPKKTPYPPALSDTTPPPKSSNDAMTTTGDVLKPMFQQRPQPLADVADKTPKTGPEPPKKTPYPPALSDTTPPPKSSKEAMTTTGDVLKPLFQQRPQPLADVADKTPRTGPEPLTKTPYPPALSDTTPPPKSSNDAMTTTGDVLKPMFQQRPQPLADVADKTPKTGPEPVAPPKVTLSDTTPPPKTSQEAMTTTGDVLKPMYQQRPQPLADVSDPTPKTGPEPNFERPQPLADKVDRTLQMGPEPVPRKRYPDYGDETPKLTIYAVADEDDTEEQFSKNEEIKGSLEEEDESSSSPLWFYDTSSSSTGGEGSNMDDVKQPLYAETFTKVGDIRRQQQQQQKLYEDNEMQHDTIDDEYEDEEYYDDSDEEDEEDDMAALASDDEEYEYEYDEEEYYEDEEEDEYEYEDDEYEYEYVDEEEEAEDTDTADADAEAEADQPLWFYSGDSGGKISSSTVEEENDNIVDNVMELQQQQEEESEQQDKPLWFYSASTTGASSDEEDEQQPDYDYENVPSVSPPPFSNSNGPVFYDLGTSVPISERAGGVVGGSSSRGGTAPPSMRSDDVVFLTPQLGGFLNDNYNVSPFSLASTSSKQQGTTTGGYIGQGQQSVTPPTPKTPIEKEEEIDLIMEDETDEEEFYEEDEEYIEEESDAEYEGEDEEYEYYDEDEEEYYEEEEDVEYYEEDEEYYDDEEEEEYEYYEEEEEEYETLEEEDTPATTMMFENEVIEGSLEEATVEEDKTASFIVNKDMSNNATEDDVTFDEPTATLKEEEEEEEVRVDDEKEEEEAETEAEVEQITLEVSPTEETKTEQVTTMEAEEEKDITKKSPFDTNLDLSDPVKFRTYSNQLFQGYSNFKRGRMETLKSKIQETKQQQKGEEEEMLVDKAKDESKEKESLKEESKEEEIAATDEETKEEETVKAMENEKEEKKDDTTNTKKSPFDTNLDLSDPVNFRTYSNQLFTGYSNFKRGRMETLKSKFQETKQQQAQKEEETLVVQAEEQSQEEESQKEEDEILGDEEVVAKEEELKREEEEKETVPPSPPPDDKEKEQTRNVEQIDKVSTTPVIPMTMTSTSSSKKEETQPEPQPQPQTSQPQQQLPGLAYSTTTALTFRRTTTKQSHQQGTPPVPLMGRAHAYSRVTRSQITSSESNNYETLVTDLEKKTGDRSSSSTNTISPTFLMGQAYSRALSADNDATTATMSRIGKTIRKDGENEQPTKSPLLGLAYSQVITGATPTKKKKKRTTTLMGPGQAYSQATTTTTSVKKATTTLGIVQRLSGAGQAYSIMLRDPSLLLRIVEEEQDSENDSSTSSSKVEPSTRLMMGQAYSRGMIQNHPTTSATTSRVVNKTKESHAVAATSKKLLGSAYSRVTTKRSSSSRDGTTTTLVGAGQAYSMVSRKKKQRTGTIPSQMKGRGEAYSLLSQIPSNEQRQSMVAQEEREMYFSSEKNVTPTTPTIYNLGQAYSVAINGDDTITPSSISRIGKTLKDQMKGTLKGPSLLGLEYSQVTTTTTKTKKEPPPQTTKLMGPGQAYSLATSRTTSTFTTSNDDDASMIPVTGLGQAYSLMKKYPSTLLQTEDDVKTTIEQQPQEEEETTFNDDKTNSLISCRGQAYSIAMNGATAADSMDTLKNNDARNRLSRIGKRTSLASKRSSSSLLGMAYSKVSSKRKKVQPVVNTIEQAVGPGQAYSLATATKTKTSPSGVAEPEPVVGRGQAYTVLRQNPTLLVQMATEEDSSEDATTTTNDDDTIVVAEEGTSTPNKITTMGQAYSITMLQQFDDEAVASGMTRVKDTRSAAISSDRTGSALLGAAYSSVTTTKNKSKKPAISAPSSGMEAGPGQAYSMVTTPRGKSSSDGNSSIMGMGDLYSRMKRGLSIDDEQVSSSLIVDNEDDQDDKDFSSPITLVGQAYSISTSKKSNSLTNEAISQIGRRSTATAGSTTKPSQQMQAGLSYSKATASTLAKKKKKGPQSAKQEKTFSGSSAPSMTRALMGVGDIYSHLVRRIDITEEDLKTLPAVPNEKKLQTLEPAMSEEEKVRLEVEKARLIQIEKDHTRRKQKRKNKNKKKQTETETSKQNPTTTTQSQPEQQEQTTKVVIVDVSNRTKQKSQNETTTTTTKKKEAEKVDNDDEQVTKFKNDLLKYKQTLPEDPTKKQDKATKTSTMTDNSSSRINMTNLNQAFTKGAETKREEEEDLIKKQLLLEAEQEQAALDEAKRLKESQKSFKEKFQNDLRIKKKQLIAESKEAKRSDNAAPTNTDSRKSIKGINQAFQETAKQKATQTNEEALEEEREQAALEEIAKLEQSAKEAEEAAQMAEEEERLAEESYQRKLEKIQLQAVEASKEKEAAERAFLEAEEAMKLAQEELCAIEATAEGCNVEDLYENKEIQEKMEEASVEIDAAAQALKEAEEAVSFAEQVEQDISELMKERRDKLDEVKLRASQRKEASTKQQTKIMDQIRQVIINVVSPQKTSSMSDEKWNKIHEAKWNEFVASKKANEAFMNLQKLQAEERSLGTSAMELSLEEAKRLKTEQAKEKESETTAMSDDPKTQTSSSCRPFFFFGKKKQEQLQEKQVKEDSSSNERQAQLLNETAADQTKLSRSTSQNEDIPVKQHQDIKEQSKETKRKSVEEVRKSFFVKTTKTNKPSNTEEGSE